MKLIQVDIQLNNGNSIGCIFFADDYAGIMESFENLQLLIDIVHDFCRKRPLRAIVNKSAALAFDRDKLKVSGN